MNYWIYNNQEIDEIPDKNAVGFIYKITRLNVLEDPCSPIYYIGKKLFYKKSKKESDWRNYYGSSKWLKKHINKYKKENFRREIIEICYSKSELTYKEVGYQIKNDVLYINKNSIMKKKYYNLNILGKFYTNQFFTKEDLERISKIKSDVEKEYEKIYLNNGKEEVLLNTTIESLIDFLKENPDFEMGRLYRPSPLKNKTCVTNDIINLFINNEEVEEFLKDNPDFYIGSKFKGKFIIINDGINRKKWPMDKPIPNGWKKDGIKKINIDDKVHVYNEENYTEMTIPRYWYENKYKKEGWKIGRIKHKTIWMNFNTINKKVKLHLVDDYYQQGWNFGRYNNYNKDTVLMINEKGEKKYIKLNEIQKFIDKGYEFYSEENKYIKIEKNNIVKVILKTNLQNFLSNEWKIYDRNGKDRGTKNKILVYDNTKKNLEEYPLIINQEEYKKNKDKYILRKTYHLRNSDKNLKKSEINKIKKYYKILYPKVRKIPEFKYRNIITKTILRDIEIYLKDPKKWKPVPAPTNQNIREKRYPFEPIK